MRLNHTNTTRPDVYTVHRIQGHQRGYFGACGFDGGSYLLTGIVGGRNMGHAWARERYYALCFIDRQQPPVLPPLPLPSAFVAA